ncbi:30366_t:CDS:2, partial [Racocetra persica]
SILEHYTLENPLLLKKLEMSSRRGDRSRSESPQRKKHPISEDDYFTKSAEFRTWLREKKDKFFDELSSEQARRYFKKFKYYDGMRSSQLTSSETTRYKWKHLKVNQHELDELDTIKHSVDRQTNVKFATEVQMRSSGIKNEAPKRIIGPSMPPVRGSVEYNEDLDQEDKERYERALRKKDRKNFQATHDMVLEELVPKATGKEALIEKKRARNNYYRREASPDIELNESDLMGGDDYES